MSTDGTRVLVPVDDSDHAQRAADLAAELFPGGTLVLLHVVNPTEIGFGAEAAIRTFPEGWYEEAVEHAERIFETITRLKENVTILLVEQNFSFASALGDRYYILDQGEIVSEGPMASLEADEELRAEYLGVT